MTSLQFDLGPTLKTLNLSLLRFIERYGLQNHTHYLVGEGLMQLANENAHFTYKYFNLSKIHFNPIITISLLGSKYSSRKYPFSSFFKEKREREREMLFSLPFLTNYK